ncbi:squalene cyclase [Chaetomidium leptoderma]|uniref:Squalene cyclase n=1 Tax=Chaetomidium leptoderma TaxID=669021 RepID=A0AAN6ZVL1_9PEZI|nr:squalene cyclase [Chaetomidium leptoderma]
MAQDELDELRGAVDRTVQQAIDFSFSCQQANGHWVAPVSADATFTAQYVMFKHAIPGLNLDNNGGEAAALRRWLLGDQNKSEGSWGLAPGLPGNLSTTVEAYLALRLLGTPASDPALRRARDFVLAEGGIARVRFFTRFFLATFGLFPWSAIPQMPAELILMPTWSPLNIYVLSSWARSTLIPILVVRHHEPVYALPNGRRDSNNDYLDELWVDPTDKQVPFAPPLWDMFYGRDRDVLKLAFTLGDKVLAQLGGLKKGPQRRLALRRCIDWLLEHQEKAGDWAGFFPPMHGSVWALLLEGFPLQHDVVQRGLQALERLAVNDDSGKWLQSTVSPCWDTALMVKALCEAGLGLGGDRASKGDHDARISAAVDWVRSLQLLGSQGDWRVYSRNQQPGGWSFEYHNTWYPDVDDTAVVVMMLVVHDPAAVESEAVEMGVEWILGMQNHDGGWGAFDTNNDALWLHKIPFSDMDSLVDPSTADVTGRMLECFGMLLTHRKGGRRLRAELARRLRESAQKALDFLFKEQTSSGAWWGRWGCNYNYGTTNVLRGLPAFCSDKRVATAALRAILWLETCQNGDGGWGETLLSYGDPSLAGQGPSTAAHTAWALDALLRFRPASDLALQRGARWLVTNQSAKTEEQRQWSSWPSDLYVGTGFPNVLYLGYPFYHHHFAISALARFLDSSKTGRGCHRPLVDQDLPQHLVTALSRQDILLMVLGSRGDIDIFLSIAKRLEEKGHRVRVATHPTHQALVDSHGFEFYDVGGGPDEFAQVLGREPNLLWSIVRGDLGKLRQSLCSIFARFWQAGFDDNYASGNECYAADKGQHVADSRPFIADLVVSIPATTVHVHAAESLQAPLVLVSAQPTLPTREFPHVFTMNTPRFSPGRWWNYATFFLLELLNWLAMGSFVNSLRANTYRMNPVCWVWATRDFFRTKVPHVCLWSPRIVPRPAEWQDGVVIAGSTALNRGNGFIPPAPLSTFLKTDADRPTVVVSFGSMHIPDPRALISAISWVADKAGAKVIICRSWPAKMETCASPAQHVLVADDIPHSWLLPRVDGFVHHGGAGHTAAGLGAGVPMLIMPFLLDQHFWAAKVHGLGLGPAPLEIIMRAGSSGGMQSGQGQMKLAQSMRDLLSGQYRDRCAEMAKQVRADGDGADVAADVIEGELGTARANAGPCVVVPALSAQWQHAESGLALSGAAAASLVASGMLCWDDLDTIARVDWAAATRLGQAPKSRLHMFCAVADWLVVLCSMLIAIFGWLIQLPGQAHGVAGGGVKARDGLDPVRSARIKRSVVDLHLLRQNIGAKDGPAAVDEQFAGRWQAATAAQFQQIFESERA